MKSFDRRSLLPFFWDDTEKPVCNHFHDHEDIALSEDNTHVYVEAAVPGMAPEEIEISYEKGILCIKADKKEEEKDEKRKVYRKMNRHFFYQIPVPGKINESQIPEAICKDGMLKVCFSKEQNTQKKKISVKKG